MKAGTKKTNIIHIIVNLDIGGTEKRLVETITHLSKKKYNLAVCCLLNQGRYAEQLTTSGIDVIALNKTCKMYPDILFRLVALFKKRKADLVHTHMFIPNFWGRLAGIIARVPIIISSEVTPYRWNRPLQRLIDKVLIPKTDIIIVNSNAVRRFLLHEHVPEQKITLIYGGKNIDEFNIKINKRSIRKELGIDSARFVIGNITKFRREKGMEYLIQSIPIITKALPGTTFLLVGEGSEENKLRSLARTLQINKHVVFAGLRTDIPRILKSLDLLVLPSLYEGLPNVVIEAMLASVPVVATQVGGTPEIVIHDQTGILVPPADPQALADAIIKILLSPEKRAIISQKAQLFTQQKFAIESSVKQLEFLYDSLIEKKLCRYRS